MGDLRLLPRYIVNLGFFRGVKTFIAGELLELSTLHVAGVPMPVHIRPKTSDLSVFREVFLFREYDFFVGHPPRIIIDAGANIGLSTIYFRTKFNDAIIYSIEPDVDNFAMLVQNVSKYDKVIPIQSALWPNSAFLRIKDKSGPSWAFEIEEMQISSNETVDAISIESLMRTYQLDTIDILKLDVEGSEREIFSSNYEYWLPRTKIIIIELHDWMKEGCSRSFFQTISKYRFKMSIHRGMLLFTNLDIK